ncbi:MAG: DUF393 domain-containing protein [Bacteroidales bacterium]|nr:DUF393 domain-containing protein [Bacteroidales bacterium]
MNRSDPAPGHGVVIYDGECALCQKSIAILRRLDWRNRLAYHNAREFETLPPATVALEPSRLLEEMHVLTPDRARAPSGFRAIRWIAWRLPLLWPIAPLLYCPGVLWFGQKLYLRIARNRFDLVPCAHGACAVRRPKT